MSESKHTPGPWIASKWGFQVLTGDSWNTICRLTEDAGRDFRGASWEDGRKSKIIEANANLIAAAPELLEALEAALPILDDAHQDAIQRAHSDTAWIRVAESLGLQCDTARAAIAKAKGEA